MKIILGYNGNDEQESLLLCAVRKHLVEVLGLEVEGRGSAGYDGSKIAPVLQRAEGEVILIATDDFLRCSRHRHAMFGFSAAGCAKDSESSDQRYEELTGELVEKAYKLARGPGAVPLERHMPYLVHNVRWMREICKDLKIIRLVGIPTENENVYSECNMTTTTQVPPERLAASLARIIRELKA